MSRLIKAIAVTAALGIPYLLPTVLIAETWTAAPLALLESFIVWIPILIFIVGSFAYGKETSANAVAFSSLFLSAGLLEFVHMVSRHGMQGGAYAGAFGQSALSELAVLLMAAVSFLAVVVFSWNSAEKDSRIGPPDKGEPRSNSANLRSLSGMKLAQKKERMATSVFEHISEGIMVTDSRQTIHYVNPAFTSITGYTEADIVGASPKILSSGKHNREFYDNMWNCIRQQGSWQGEIWNRRKNGDVFLESITITAVKESADYVAYYIAVFKDITVQKQLEARLRHQAYHDTVTGLPNRLLLNERIDEAVRHADHNRRLFAILFLDLDRFKRINDTLGHSAGDQLLKTIAERLVSCLRGSDTIARIGGDEFVVLLCGLAHAEDSVAIAQKIIQSLTSPIFLGRHELYVTVSIGISFYPNDGRDAHTLIKHADQAMYKAKDQGRNNYQLYTPAKEDHAPQLLSMETSLRRAIAYEQLYLHYQPQFDAATRQMIGIEALVRWSHPDWGNIPPSRFIPLAEETGLITLLDQWVLREACAQLKRWLDEGYSPLPVSVNVSMLQFRQPNLGQFISRVLADTGLPARYLEIELTESTIMSNPDVTLQTLHELKRMGIRISLDDFGVGYSSLNYLKKLPIDTIKIDQSFVKDIPEDANDKAIVQTIIHLSQNLRLGVIAEGVETEAQLQYLQSQQCKGIQGYLLSRPVPHHEITRFFAS
jgi:diguanylate cyclase (GGDEF)-like protein/PAS domain S-box-containing protein